MSADLVVVVSRRAAAREIDARLEAGAAGPGGVRAAFADGVVTPTDLVDRALAGHPSARPRLSATAERLLAAEVCEGLEPAVRRLFGPGAEAPAAARAIGAALAEIRMAGLRAIDLAPATGRRRVRALAAALDAWERALERSGRWDDADAHRAAAERIEAGAWPEGGLGRLEVRGLYDATPLQGRLLLALARAARAVRVSTPFDPHDEDATGYAFPWLHLWESLDEPGLDVELEFDDAARAPARVTAEEAADPAAEARGAAAWARALVEGGAAPEEIAIVAPADRALAIGLELERRGVPFHARRSAPFESTPFAQAALLPFRLFEEGWRRTDLAAWVASPLLTGLDPALLAPALAEGPAGRADLAEWRSALGSARGESAARLVAALRDLAALESGERAPAEFWSEYRAALDRVGLDAGDDPALVPLRETWESALADLEEGSREIGRWDGPRAGWRAHRRRLAIALSGRVVPLGRPGRGVQVLTPHDARGLDFRHAAVVGLAQGALARVSPSRAVLGDAERRAIDEALGARLFRTAGEEAREGALLLHDRIARTSGSLRLSYPARDGSGQPLLPALELERARAAAGVPLAAATAPAPSWRAWPEDVVARLQAIERDRTDFFSRPVPDRAAWAGRHDGAFDAAIAEELARTLADGRLAMWSGGALESWRQCPHQFFVRRVLKLEPPEESAVEAEATAVGELAHGALRILFATAPSPGAAGPDEIAAAVDEASALVRARRRGDARVWRVHGRRVAAILARYLAAQAAWPPAGARPAAEISFGLAPDAPPGVALETSRGAALLRGRIDRIDHDAATGEARVVDYKYSRESTRHRSAGLEERCGVDRFQLWSYALGARAWAEWAGAAAPASVTGEIHCLKGPRLYPALDLSDADAVARGIVTVVEESLAGPYDPSPRDVDGCRYCEARRACRIATVAAAVPPLDEEDER